jgi:hypothetical protein
MALDTRVDSIMVNSMGLGYLLTPKTAIYWRLRGKTVNGMELR